MKKGKDYIGVGCGAFIFNDEGELLLIKRTENCRNTAGFWSIPGGGVDFGESVEDAVVREIKEELDVDIEVIGLLTVSNDIIEAEGQHWVSPQFISVIKSGELKNMEPEKCSEFRFFDLNDLPEKLTKTTIDGINVLKKKESK